MRLTWRKGFDPEAVLERIRPLRTLDGGKVAFKGWEVEQHVTVLQSMIEPPEEIPSEIADGLVWRGLFAAGATKDFKAGDILRCIGKSFDGYLAEVSQSFTLATTISLVRTDLPDTIAIEDTKLAFLAHLPGPLRELRDKARSEFRNFARHSERTDYAWVTATVKARSEHEAGSIAINAVDLVRGIWNMSATLPMRRTLGGPKKAINAIVLGELHTLHREGNLGVGKICWHEPDYRTDVPPYRYSRNDNALQRSFLRTMKRLQGCKYKGDIKRAIVRYCRALDCRDLDVAFTRLWQALERLTNTSTKGSYEQTIERTSFLYENWRYEREVLRHLRARRNDIVHDGGAFAGAETSVYLLKGCVEDMIAFHLHMGFDTIAEAGEFLDLSRDIPQLRRKRALIDRALTFRKADGDAEVSGRSDQDQRD